MNILINSKSINSMYKSKKPRFTVTELLTPEDLTFITWDEIKDELIES